MKFSHQNFDLTVIQKTNSQGLAKNKPLEFIFGDDLTFKKHFGKLGGNFRNKDSSECNSFIIEHDKLVSLNTGYFYEDGINNVFYDYHEMEFELTNGYNLSIQSDYNTCGFLEDISKIEDENKRYKLSYNLIDEEDKVYGFWGFVKFNISNSDEDFIFAPFFKTKNLEEDEEVKKMLSVIKEELFYSLFTNRNISLSSYKLKREVGDNQPLWSFINIFELIYKSLEISINDIHENAKYINISNHEVVKYKSGKIVIDNRFIKDTIKKGYYDLNTSKLDIYGKNIIQKKIRGEYNNVSNKIFIDLNQKLIDKLNKFLSVGKGNIREDYLDSIKAKKDKISAKRNSFINKYELNLMKLSNYSIDYQHLDSKYKRFVINYLKLFFMLDLLNGDIMLANKSIDQIYEYWVLIRTRDILNDLLKSDEKKPVFNIRKQNDQLLFELGNNYEVKIGDSDCQITYVFQKSIPSISNETKTSKNDLRILSALAKPDIYIKIEKSSGEEKNIILDAKFSTNEDGNINKNRFENLYKYKTGVVRCTDIEFNESENSWLGSLKPVIDEVIAIYPGKKEERIAKIYKKSINDIGFGGLVMKTRDDEDIKDYFRNLIG